MCIPTSLKWCVQCLTRIVSGRWNYLRLHFPVSPQGILVICALLLFLSGVGFPCMLCSLFDIGWQICLERINSFYFFPPCYCFSL